MENNSYASTAGSASATAQTPVRSIPRKVEMLRKLCRVLLLFPWSPRQATQYLRASSNLLIQTMFLLRYLCPVPECSWNLLSLTRFMQKERHILRLIRFHADGEAH